MPRGIVRSNQKKIENIFKLDFKKNSFNQNQKMKSINHQRIFLPHLIIIYHGYIIQIMKQQSLRI